MARSAALEAVQGEYVDCRTVSWQDEACERAT